MNRLALVAAAAATLLVAGVAVAAANPSASPSASARPSASAQPSSSPSASASPNATTTRPTFTAKVRPLQIRGSARIVETAAGGATVTLRLTGLVDDQRWRVDIDGGTVSMPNDSVEIAQKAGSDVTRLSTDTIRIRLTKAEMAAFLKARSHGGVVAEVSDGTRVGYAEFAGS
jgi:hypothetical protein